MKVPIKKRYQREDGLRRKFEDEDLLLCQIAELCEVSLTTISRWAARFEIREVRPYSGDRHGQNNPYWKGGRYKDKGSGYIMVYQPEHPQANSKGYLPEHRLKMEHCLGRPLESNEKVRHKNNKKDDNRLANLELFVLGRPKGEKITCPFCEHQFKIN